jgi:hypothetical protein
MFEEHVADHLARGQLVRMLEDWCPPFDGYFPTTRAGVINHRRCRRWSTRFECDLHPRPPFAWTLQPGRTSAC